MRIAEAMDDVEVPETQAPQMFERTFSEYMEFEDTGLKYDELPKPALWRVLVLPKQPKKKSAGGIVLPEQTQEAEAHLNYIGQIVGLGPLAGRNDKFLNPAWTHPKNKDVTDWEAFERENGPRYLWDFAVGDWVIYGRYSGQVITFKGIRLLTLNDDDVAERIPDPSGFRVYV